MHGDPDPGDVDRQRRDFLAQRRSAFSTVSRLLQPSNPKIRLASEIAYQPSR
jgi:hypothetical protein